MLYLFRIINYFFICTLFLCFIQVQSQEIKINVNSKPNLPINDVNVLIKELDNPSIVKEFFILKNNFISFKLKKKYKSILIELTSINYLKETFTIKNPIKNKTYELDFFLKKNTITKLDEIVIKVPKKTFIKKKDTIKYNVSSYLDGSESKIEDVLKKLQGVQVNYKTGEIKYKGKSIETVTLDGDNLFGKNYTLATKNINVAIVDKIEAIDNYTENPLLKGIEQGGKVSLNLKLKKRKFDFSGDLDLGNGLFANAKPALDLNSNILGINKFYKSFAKLSYNNVGLNRTPFDYFGFNFNVEEQKELNYLAEKIIPESHFSNLLEDKRANINNQFFANYNAIFKVNSNLSIKTNLYYLQDKISSNQLFKNDFIINNESFTTTDNTFLTKIPIQFRSDIHIKYNGIKLSLIEYSVKLQQENITTSKKIIQNKSQELSTLLNTENFFLKQNLLFTKKLSNKRALQVQLFHSFNNLSQNLNIEPSLFYVNSNKISQEGQFKKTFLEAKAAYLGVNIRDKYSFTFGINTNITPFNSNLYSLEESLSKNNFNYTKNSIFNKGTYNFNRGKFQISPSYTLRILHQNLVHNIQKEEIGEKDFILEPKLNLKYKLNSNSFLSANLFYFQKAFTNRYLFLNNILINNRTLLINSPSLNLQHNKRYSLTYFMNDLYHQFLLNLNLSHNVSKGNFFANQIVSENTIQIEYFYLPQNINNLNLDIEISKYIPFLESTLKFTGVYSLSNYKNIINNSDLRKNESQFFSNSFFWKSALEVPFNFENIVTVNHSYSKSENQLAFINNSFQNRFKIIVKPNKKWLLFLSSNYFIPNTEQLRKKYFFLDTTLNYKPINKKWKADFIVKNLTNENNFEQVETSDIGTSIYKSNLLSRYFLLSLTWSF